MKQLQSVAHLFKTLSEPVRLRILNLLIHADGEICVCDLMTILAVPQSVVSRHLAYLRKSGLVKARREGVWMHYSLSDESSVLAQSVLQSITQFTQNNETLTADITAFRASC